MSPASALCPHCHSALPDVIVPTICPNCSTPVDTSSRPLITVGKEAIPVSQNGRSAGRITELTFKASLLFAASELPALG
jgi:hypothetical protein